ncbi:MAG TPA: hypothetical protein DCY98_05705 [Nitrospinae bacterium]|nr:hypothetical protein [Nitrospinota bacterium]
MKKVIVVLTILFMSILEGQSFSEMSVLNKEGTLSIDYTMHLKQQKSNEEVCIYLSTLQKDREWRIKTYEIVKGLCNELVSEGYTRIPSNYPVPPRRESAVNVIQMEEGINITIHKDGFMKEKLFDEESEEQIVMEILVELFGIDV